MSVIFERVVIVGVGLLGASLGLALRGRGMARRVVGVGREGSRSLEVALGRGAVDEVSTDVGGAVAGADLVVLCTPVRQFPEMMRGMAGKLKEGAVVTDVGSVKGEVMGWAREWLPGVEFVGSHPMAGSEKSGPEAAKAGLYERAVCLMCRGESSAGAFERVKGMWEGVGMRVMELEAGEHDRWVATVSHLPHAVAFGLVNAAAREPGMLEAAAGGFIDTTRVASSDVDMWVDIFLTNKGAVLGALEVFAGEMAAMWEAVAAGDEGRLRKILSGAKGARDGLVARRNDAGIGRRGDAAREE